VSARSSHASHRLAIRWLAAFCACGVASSAAAAGPWDIPAPGSCESGPATASPSLIDAPPFPFKTGDVIGAEQLALLREFIPSLLWENREQFFFEGMRLEVGACFADYAAPAFFHAAGEKFRGEPKLTEEGGLADYVAGQPFLPADIAPDEAEGGLKWAWNYAMRYRGAGFDAEFRISDIVGAYGRAEPFIGRMYRAQVAFRSDQEKKGYRAKGNKKIWWVAGGRMTEPFNARGHAWRQFRDVKSTTDSKRSDDLHAFIATARRVRRLSAAYIQGLYLPSFSVGITGLPTLDGADGGGAASSPDQITPKRSGWEGIEIRPLRATWKVRGVQDVLTPINASNPMYPAEKGRDFGVWGLSFASDRWDLRRAIVLEATYESPDEEKESLARMVMHFDLQTLAPLYYQSWDKRGETIDVGLYVGRFSEDREDYPAWPDDDERPVRVIDPVGAAFANVSQRVGWRRESWDATSTPSSSKGERNKISVQGLTKGH